MFWRTIYGMTRALANLLGTVALLIDSLLWLSVLKASGADRFVNGVFGTRNEYKVVLGAALVGSIFSLAASIRGCRYWLLGLCFSVGTLGYFTYALSR